MALTERVTEGAFTGAVEVVLGTWTAGVSTLLSLRTLSDVSGDLELLIRHKKVSTYTDLFQGTVVGTVTGAKSIETPLPLGALDAADESIVATLNGAGTFRWQAVWLDRT